MSIIKVENLSKKYRILHRKDRARYATFRDEFTNFISGKKSTKEDIWVLRDVNFQVESGEIVGIIGPNGAGKTTLLKVLTRITSPTKGEVTINGSVGSLLEVGTGFHPELTGRENIYLNGAILGMTKKEIRKKFDQIVEFAGIEKFLDTPAKRYSSGMYVRLAFSVAAHLEPDILLVDEVLAVGDAEFQKKCLGKMKEVTRNAKRTILFVSHNMDAVRSLCNRIILIDKGRIKYVGDVKEGINKYLSTQKNSSGSYKEYSIKPRLAGQVRSIKLKNKLGHPCDNFQTNEKAIAEVCFELRQDLSGYEFVVCVFKNSTPIWLSSDGDFDYFSAIKKSKGIYKKEVELPINLLKPGSYAIGASISARGRVAIDYQFIDVLNFNLTLSNKNLLNTSLHPDKLGFLAVLKKWEDVK